MTSTDDETTASPDAQAGTLVTKPRAADTSAYTPCGSYRVAVQMAASRRREGGDSYAVFVTALNEWCVT